MYCFTCIKPPLLITLAAALTLWLPRPILAEENRILPDQWSGIATYSPNGKSIAIESPPPERVPFTAKDGTIQYSLRRPNVEHTFILDAKSFVTRAKVAANDSFSFPTWSPDSNYLATHTWSSHKAGDWYIAVCNTSGEIIRTFEVLEPAEFQWSPSGDFLLIAQRKNIGVYPILSSDNKEMESDDQDWYWEDPIWSPDGKQVAARCSRKPSYAPACVIKVWNADTGSCLHSIELSTNPMKIPWSRETMSWSPNGKLLVYSAKDGVHSVALENMQQQKILSSDNITPAPFSFSPDGKLIAHQDGQFIRVTELDGLKERIKIAGPTNGWYSFKWSPSGDYILIDGRDTLAIADARTGKYLGYKSFPDNTAANWTPGGGSLILWQSSGACQFVALTMPPRNADTSIFDGGNPGSPGWENKASPKSLEECFAQFDKELTSEQLQKFKTIKEKDLYLFGGGHIITDGMMVDVSSKWGLSDLQKWFETKGITEPCDVHGIMLASYWRYLNAKPLNVDEQIRFHKAWWSRSESPVSTDVRPLTQDLLHTELKTRDKKSLYLSALPARANIVSFIDTDCCPTEMLLKHLCALKKKYKSEDVSISVIVFDHKAYGTRKQHKQKNLYDSQGHIEQILKDPNSGFALVYGSHPLLIKIYQFLSNRNGLPQTLVVNSKGIVSCQINGWDIDEDPDVDIYKAGLAKALSVALSTTKK